MLLRAVASRIAFRHLAYGFGETCDLILDYVGPAITTSLPLQKVRGLCCAALFVQLLLFNLRPPTRCLGTHCANIFNDGLFEDSPAGLNIIYQQQRDTLAAITNSIAPLQLQAIHELRVVEK